MEMAKCVDMNKENHNTSSSAGDQEKCLGVHSNSSS